MRETRRHAFALAICWALLAWITLGQYRLVDRLLFRDREQFGFVLVNVDGVLDGHPVSKSWQQRFIGPSLVRALDRMTDNGLDSLMLFGGLMAFAANGVLFALMRRKGASLLASFAIVIGFDFAHFLLMYKLEYPWDGIDILIFFGFGYWLARGGPLLALVPLLLVGLFNHETVLYIPFFYLLAWVLGHPLVHPRREALVSLALLVALCAAIYALREHFYLGRPHLPARVFERATPVIENHMHVEHNLRQLFIVNWREQRSFISLGFFAACSWLVALCFARELRAPALWSLCVLASIVCFGYTNETRHYLLLVAFWFAYALPEKLGAGALSARRAASLPRAPSGGTASP